MICITVAYIGEPSVTGCRRRELQGRKRISPFGVTSLKALRATRALRRASFSAGAVVRSQTAEPGCPRSGKSRYRSAPLSGGIGPIPNVRRGTGTDRRGHSPGRAPASSRRASGRSAGDAPWRVIADVTELPAPPGGPSPALPWSEPWPAARCSRPCRPRRRRRLPRGTAARSARAVAGGTSTAATVTTEGCSSRRRRGGPSAVAPSPPRRTRRAGPSRSSWPRRHAVRDRDRARHHGRLAGAGQEEPGPRPRPARARPDLGGLTARHRVGHPHRGRTTASTARSCRSDRCSSATSFAPVAAAMTGAAARTSSGAVPLVNHRFR